MPAEFLTVVQFGEARLSMNRALWWGERPREPLANPTVRLARTLAPPGLGLGNTPAARRKAGSTFDVTKVIVPARTGRQPLRLRAGRLAALFLIFTHVKVSPAERRATEQSAF